MKIEITSRELLLIKNGLRSKSQYYINHAWDEFTESFLESANEYTTLLKNIEEQERSFVNKGKTEPL